MRKTTREVDSDKKPSEEQVREMSELVREIEEKAKAEIARE